MNEIFYNKKTLSILNNNNIDYLFDCNNYDYHKLYFSAKNKKDYTLINKEEFMKNLLDIKEYIEGYNLIVYPESSSSFLKDFLNLFNVKIIELKKNNKDYIDNEFINNNKLSKDEISSHNKRFLEMGTGFKINKIKSNKRKFYEHLIFEKIDIRNEKLLIVDDFICTGSTINGIRKSLNVDCDIFSLFKK